MTDSFPNARWVCKDADPNQVTALQRELRIHPIIAHLLVGRGVNSPTQAESFLSPSMDELSDPFLLPDAAAACERLKQALVNKERIQVYGDYDGDGVTSTALWTRMLTALGGEVLPFVPHRKRDGYDLRADGVETAARNKCSLILTTDCGIQRVDEVEHARGLGIDVIITDHHLPHEKLPSACAVVNPHRADSGYPFKDLAGVGVAFRLGEALVRTLGQSVTGYHRAYIDLCAIGTITDIMPLTHDNRILVSHGLKSLASSKKPGIRALLKFAAEDRKSSGGDVTVETVSFGLGPRLNAASRMGETDLALKLLLTRDHVEGEILAGQLNQMNLSRREDQRKIFTEAVQLVEEYPEDRCLVVSGEGWSAGLVGLVAGKLLEKTGRPAIVIACDSDTNVGRGSARSIPAFHIADALQRCSDLLKEFGGHSCAAGFSIDPQNIPLLRYRINEIASTQLTDSDLAPVIDVDMAISLDDLSEDLMEGIWRLAPFGNGNPMPVFVSEASRLVEVKTMGKEQEHLRLLFRAEGIKGDKLIAAPLWRMGKYAAEFEKFSSLDICYSLALNEFNGRTSLQLEIKDIRPPD